MTINRLESLKNNSTHFYSLHNTKIYTNSNNINENQTKLNNFDLALTLIRNKYINHINSINFQKLTLIYQKKKILKNIYLIQLQKK